MASPSRTGFIKDSSEYNEFLKVMRKIMEGVKISLQKLTMKKEGKKVSRALKDALQRIYRALAANPDLSPFDALPICEQTKGFGGAAAAPKEGEGEGVHEEEIKAEEKPAVTEKKKKKKKPKVKRLTPNAIIKKIRFGETGVSCVVDSFG
jgi:hypothetical protein